MRLRWQKTVHNHRRSHHEGVAEEGNAIERISCEKVLEAELKTADLATKRFGKTGDSGKARNANNGCKQTSWNQGRLSDEKAIKRKIGRACISRRCWAELR